MPLIKLSFSDYPRLTYFLNAFSTVYTDWYIILSQSHDSDISIKNIITAEVHIYAALDSKAIEDIHKLGSMAGMLSMEVSKPDTRIMP